MQSVVAPLCEAVLFGWHLRDVVRASVVGSYSLSPFNETIAQAHLFTACTFLHRTSQPKDPDFQGKKVEVVKR